MHGSDFRPPAAKGNVFLDVDAQDFAASFIEQLFLDGITAGCGSNNYCPGTAVTRAQMAVFLLRAKHGAGYSPPPATGMFSDVPLNYWAVHWIEQLAREIVRRFNNLYGEVFPEPQTLLTEAKRIPGTDGRKMSKSYQNAIYLKDDAETLRQKLRPMVTDPARKRRTDPGDPDVCPVFDLHKAFSTAETREWAAAGCRSAGIGCLDCKAKLGEHMLERLAGVHARRPELAKRPDTVWDVLLEGSKKAREVAEATMEDVRGAMKIRYSRP